MTSDRRAALVERALQAVTLSAYKKGNELKLSAEDLSAAIDLIRAEVLEEAARVIENNCHDDMTRAEEAAAIRALKDKQHD
jgi:hypothetical protein